MVVITQTEVTITEAAEVVTNYWNSQKKYKPSVVDGFIFLQAFLNTVIIVILRFASRQ